MAANEFKLEFEPSTISYSSSGTPKALRARAKQLEKSAKAAKRAKKKAKARRKVAITALERVASDPNRGYASVQAAHQLLNLDGESA